MLIEALVGYITVPLVSLAVRRRWPAEVKFACALALAALAAAVGVTINPGPFTLEGFAAAFGVTFATQQTAWRLDKLGLGSEAVNDPLIDVGTGNIQA